MARPANFQTNKNVSEIARRTGVSITTVSRKLAAGKTEADIVKDAAIYNEQQKRRRIKKEAPNTETNTETFYDAQRRREIAQASLREVELAQKRGELVPITEVNTWVAGMILRSRDILGRMGQELQDRAAQESDPHRVRALIDREVERAIAELAEFKQ